MIKYETMSYHRDQYVDNMFNELSGCSTKYIIDMAVFPFFNHLNVYFPEAYAHMMKKLKIQDIENEIK